MIDRIINSILMASKVQNSDLENKIIFCLNKPGLCLVEVFLVLVGIQRHWSKPTAYFSSCALKLSCWACNLVSAATCFFQGSTCIGISLYDEFTEIVLRQLKVKLHWQLQFSFAVHCSWIATIENGYVQIKPKRLDFHWFLTDHRKGFTR